MILFEPFAPEHLAALPFDDAWKLLSSGAAEELAKHPAFTGRLNGRVVGCAGVHPFLWDGRWNAWAFLTDETGPHMLQITRFVRFVLANFPVPRLEAHVRAGFPQGVKFARALGFTLETPEPMRHWAADGTHAYQFARTE